MVKDLQVGQNQSKENFTTKHAMVGPVVRSLNTPGVKKRSCLDSLHVVDVPKENTKAPLFLNGARLNSDSFKKEHTHPLLANFKDDNNGPQEQQSQVHNKDACGLNPNGPTKEIFATQIMGKSQSKSKEDMPKIVTWEATKECMETFNVTWQQEKSPISCVLNGKQKGRKWRRIARTVSTNSAHFVNTNSDEVAVCLGK